METKGKRYVVGYSSKGSRAIYTSERAWVYDDGGGGMQKMTYSQALKLARNMPSGKASVAIFELVPVQVGKPHELVKIESFVRKHNGVK